MSDKLLAISPIDGRYDRYTASLKPVASEFGLIKYRVEVMIRYLITLCEKTNLTNGLSSAKKDYLFSIINTFRVEDALVIKAIETKGWGVILATNHDVKACELWLRHELEANDMKSLVEFIHFGCTSEDVNNVAYGLMLRDTLNEVLPALRIVKDQIRKFAERYANLPMLARTHGQAATPLTFGKEMAVYEDRLATQMLQLQPFTLTLKLNGASGSYAAMHAAAPEIDWIKLSRGFIDSLDDNRYVTFAHRGLTTQIEPHDTYSELFDIFKRINVILMDFCQDMWRYISDDWVVQKPVDGEVGSSAMPHKVNPIQLENAEGNLGIANALMEYCCRKLPISRLQRDLSDSTVERVFGVIFGHCLTAYKNVSAGMTKYSANEEKIRAVLNDHPEVLSEAYQTILRRIGYPAAYDALKGLSRGKKITLDDMHAFVDGLDSTLVSIEVKTRMKALTPDAYIGLSVQLALDTL